MSRSAPRLLLISPQFHGYWESIQRAFEQLGFQVVTHCYDAAPRHEKFYNYLRHELPSRLRGEPRHLSDELVTERACRVLDEVQPDRLLVVRGDSLTGDFWAKTQNQVDATALWFYDELRRMHHDLTAVLASGAQIATYSALDAASLRGRGIDALHVPLAFDPDVPVVERAASGEVTFVGTAMPKRLAALRALQSHGIAVRAYGRSWSDNPIDRVRTWRLSGVGVPNGRDLPRAEAYAVMQASAATLNLHGDQDGFTMRTFEAAGVGAIQLIDRADVAEFYEPGTEVLVFADDDELVDLCRRIAADRDAMVGMRARARQRTLAEHTFIHRARQLQQTWG